MKIPSLLVAVALFAASAAAHGDAIEPNNGFSVFGNIASKLETPLSVVSYYFFATVCMLINDMAPWTKAFENTFSLINSIISIIVANIIGDGFCLNRLLKSAIPSFPSTRVVSVCQVHRGWIMAMSLCYCLAHATRCAFKEVSPSFAPFLPATCLFFYLYLTIKNWDGLSILLRCVPLLSIPLYFIEYFDVLPLNRQTGMLMLLNAVSETVFRLLFRSFKQTYNLGVLEGLFFLCIFDVIKCVLYCKSIIAELREIPSINIGSWILKAVLFYNVLAYFRKLSNEWIERRVTMQEYSFIILHKNLVYKFIGNVFPAISLKAVPEKPTQDAVQVVGLKLLNAILLVLGRLETHREQSAKAIDSAPTFSAFEKNSLRVFMPLIPPSLYDQSSGNHTDPAPCLSWPTSESTRQPVLALPESKSAKEQHATLETQAASPHLNASSNACPTATLATSLTVWGVLMYFIF